MMNNKRILLHIFLCGFFINSLFCTQIEKQTDVRKKEKNWEKTLLKVFAGCSIGVIGYVFFLLYNKIMTLAREKGRLEGILAREKGRLEGILEVKAAIKRNQLNLKYVCNKFKENVINFDEFAKKILDILQDNNFHIDLYSDGYGLKYTKFSKQFNQIESIVKNNVINPQDIVSKELYEILFDKSFSSKLTKKLVDEIEDKPDKDKAYLEKISFPVEFDEKKLVHKLIAGDLDNKFWCKTKILDAFKFLFLCRVLNIQYSYENFLQKLIEEGVLKEEELYIHDHCVKNVLDDLFDYLFLAGNGYVWRQFQPDQHKELKKLVKNCDILKTNDENQKKRIQYVIRKILGKYTLPIQLHCLFDDSKIENDLIYFEDPEGLMGTISKLIKYYGDKKQKKPHYSFSEKKFPEYIQELHSYLEKFFNRIPNSIDESKKIRIITSCKNTFFKEILEIENHEDKKIDKHFFFRLMDDVGMSNISGLMNDKFVNKFICGYLWEYFLTIRKQSTERVGFSVYSNSFFVLISWYKQNKFLVEDCYYSDLKFDNDESYNSLFFNGVVAEKSNLWKMMIMLDEKQKLVGTNSDKKGILEILIKNKKFDTFFDLFDFSMNFGKTQLLKQWNDVQVNYDNQHISLDQYIIDLKKNVSNEQEKELLQKAITYVKFITYK